MGPSEHRPIAVVLAMVEAAQGCGPPSETSHLPSTLFFKRKGREGGRGIILYTSLEIPSMQTIKLCFLKPQCESLIEIGFEPSVGLFDVR